MVQRRCLCSGGYVRMTENILQRAMRIDQLHEYVSILVQHEDVLVDTTERDECSIACTTTIRHSEYVRGRVRVHVVYIRVVVTGYYRQSITRVRREHHLQVVVRQYYYYSPWSQSSATPT